MTDSVARFVWYELTTTDAAAAKAFYCDVVGWGTHDIGPPGMDYTLFTVAEVPVSGLTSVPEQARNTGARPTWLGYIGVDDVDAFAARIASHGGAVHVPPTDVPNVSRFAIVADPQMATFALFKWLNPGQQQSVDGGQVGGVGWHDLFAADAPQAFAFYSALLGWHAVEAGAATDDTYRMFAAGAQTIGGMFTKPAAAFEPFWLFYFNVADIDAAAARVTAGGGRILEGPVGMPGGIRVVRCIDPQGAVFALTAGRSDKPPGYFKASPDATSIRFQLRESGR